MLYYLFKYLDELNVPGAGVFSYISFRSAAAVITSLFISVLIGKRIILLLKKKQVGEVVRELGLEEQYQKKGTPSMGGIIILASIVIPVLLFARLDNIYVLLMLLTTLWLGFIGFIDDYIKIFKKNKEGLAAHFKIIGQIILGLIIGLTLFFCEDVITVKKASISDLAMNEKIEMLDPEETVYNKDQISVEKKSRKTTIPFIKNNEFDYAWLVAFINKDHRQPWAWLVFVAIVIFIITAVSNGANLTDGLDGLATGVSAIIGTALGILAYVSSNKIYSDYLNIMFIPHSEESFVIYAASFIRRQLDSYGIIHIRHRFYGDTGSLALGGIIAVLR